MGASTGAGVASLAIGYALLVSVPHPLATAIVGLLLFVPGVLMAAFARPLCTSRSWGWVTGAYLTLVVTGFLALMALQETIASPLTFFMVGPLIWVAMTRRTLELAALSALFLAVYAAVAVLGDGGPTGYAICNLGTMAAVVIACAVRRVAMVRDQAELRRLSRTDPLTGCLNRRGFERSLEHALHAGHPFALVAFDLDGLKQVNDTHGHEAGDELLRAAAATIAEAVGPDAVVGRLGGDEFAAVVPGADAAACLPRTVAGTSYGAACFPDHGATADALFARADDALYEAKRDPARRADPLAIAGGAPATTPGGDDADGPLRPLTRVQTLGSARGGLRLAALVHLGGFVSVAIYGLVTLHKPGHWAIVAVETIGGFAALLAVRHPNALRRSSTARMVYTAVTLGATVTALVLDGGPGEPAASGFLMPVLAIAMTARPRDLLMLGSGVVIAFGGVITLTGFGPPGYTPILLVLTALAAAACCVQQSMMIRQRRQLDRISSSDVLTGCLNRRGMREALGRMAADDDARVALVSIDLDEFKHVNDTFGHAAGDDLLRWVGESIASCVSPGDKVGRMGGDEFAVLTAAPFAVAPEELAARIEAALRPRTEASIGLAVYPDEVGDLWELKKLSDDRMYESKRVAAGAAWS